MAATQQKHGKVSSGCQGAAFDRLDAHPNRMGVRCPSPHLTLLSLERVGLSQPSSGHHTRSCHSCTLLQWYCLTTVITASPAVHHVCV